VIFPDANLLLYAEDSSSPRHEQAKKWWDQCLSGTGAVSLGWPVINAFLRIATNPRIYERPLSRAEAVERVSGWLAQDCVRIVQPTEYHWQIFKRQMDEAGALGNLMADAHLAAMAIEHACTLYSTDTDFAKFPSLKWVNPLAG
jgi:toxin-antitoxin system PIN domain toxin